MDYIRQWAYGITSAAIIGAIVLSLAPRGATEKLLRTAVSLFLMCAILLPFISNANPLKMFKEIKIPDIVSSEESGKKAADYLKSELEKKVYDILIQCGINNPEVSIDITVDDLNEMKIDGISVLADSTDKDKLGLAESALKEELGIEVKIEVRQ